MVGHRFFLSFRGTRKVCLYSPFPQFSLEFTMKNAIVLINAVLFTVVVVGLIALRRRCASGRQSRHQCGVCAD
jgi:hypothetical protein